MKLKLADSRKSYRSTKILRSETLEIQPESNKKKKLQKPKPTKATTKKKANSHDQHKPEPYCPQH